MDVFHVGGGEHAVLLGGEVEDEGSGGEPFCCGVGDAHDVRECSLNNHNLELQLHVENVMSCAYIDS